MAALSSSPPRPERRPLGLGGLERVLVQSVWAAVASGGPLRESESYQSLSNVGADGSRERVNGRVQYRYGGPGAVNWRSIGMAAGLHEGVEAAS